MRTSGLDDDTRAYVVMPSWKVFEEYARRIEDEMPIHARKETPHTTKKCPVCATESPLAANACSSCGHEFAVRPRATKSCHVCDAINDISAKQCQACGAAFTNTAEFRLTLDEALRAGAIIRGMDLSEEAVQESEEIAEEFRAEILKSGDQNLIKILKLLPEEGFSRLVDVVNNTTRRGRPPN